MTPELATQAGERIRKLWPTINQEQLDEAVESLTRPEFIADKIDGAISDVYMRDSRFFQLSELRAAMLGIERTAAEKQADRVNQIIREQRQRQHEAKLAERWWTAAREVADAITPELRGRLWDEFSASLPDDLRTLYVDRFIKRGKMPREFIAWIYERETVAT